MIGTTLLERLHRAVQPGQVYLAPTDALPASEREVAREVVVCLRAGRPAAARAVIQRALEEEKLSRAAGASALHVVAASPEVRDFREAARLAELQEHYALEDGGPHLLDRLASADRHRGVVAFLLGHHELALEWFSRALERQRTPENLGNVLAALLASGARAEAGELLDTVRTGFPAGFVTDLEERILADDDLTDLRPG